MSDDHSCQALVLSCIDFRFHQQLEELLRQKGYSKFDFKTDAGAVKYIVSDEKPAVREWILENIAIARRLHGIHELVLVNHYDCGAYGGNGAFESDGAQKTFHQNQMNQAKAILAEKFPDLKTSAYFALLKDEKVELMQM